jgi:hypothetical protein
MADNVTSPVPKNTVLAADDVGGVFYPRTKMVHGPDGTAVDVSIASPLPTSRILAATGITPITATLNTVAATSAFAPILGRAFNVTHKPAAFAGSYQLERKFADDANWYVMLAYSDLTDLPQSFSLEETEAGVTYRWNMTAVSAGSVAVRISG